MTNDDDTALDAFTRIVQRDRRTDLDPVPPPGPVGPRVPRPDYSQSRGVPQPPEHPWVTLARLINQPTGNDGLGNWQSLIG